MPPTGVDGRMDRAAAAIGIGLLALAGLIGWQAAALPPASGYGLGPAAMMYVVAGGILLAGLGHLAAAVRSGLPDREPADWHAVAWIGGGLLAVIALVAFGGGFIPAMALLFAATARGFGRRRPAIDLVIGAVLGLAIYLLFTKLLTLSLPAGPLERLI